MKIYLHYCEDKKPNSSICFCIGYLKFCSKCQNQVLFIWVLSGFIRIAGRHSHLLCTVLANKLFFSTTQGNARWKSDSQSRDFRKNTEKIRRPWIHMNSHGTCKKGLAISSCSPWINMNCHRTFKKRLATSERSSIPFRQVVLY